MLGSQYPASHPQRQLVSGVNSCRMGAMQGQHFYAAADGALLTDLNAVHAQFPQQGLSVCLSVCLSV